MKKTAHYSDFVHDLSPHARKIPHFMHVYVAYSPDV